MQRKGRRAAWLLVLLAAVMEQDAGAIEEVPFGSLDPAQRNQVGHGLVACAHVGACQLRLIAGCAGRAKKDTRPSLIASALACYRPGR